MVWAVALALAVAGCAGVGELPADDQPPTHPDDLVLRVFDTGGLIGAGEHFKLPAVSLYGDGLLVLEHRSDYLVPRMQRRRLTLTGVRRVVAAAIDAGLTKRLDLGVPNIVDAPVSIFTLVTTDRHVTKVVAPKSVRGYDAAQSEARQRLHTFRKALNDLDSWLGADIAPDDGRFGAHFVYSIKTSPVEYMREERWPFEELAAGKCAILPAERADLLREAKSAWLWRSGDNVYMVVLRPVLPGERICAEVERIE